MSDRVVITGTGVVCSIGAGPDEFKTALYEGRSGVAANTPQGPNAEPYPAAEIRDFNPQTWLGPRGWRGLDRSARLHSVASFMALQSSGFAEQPGNGGYPEVGLICATMFGSLQTIASFDRSAFQDGPNLVRPVEFANAAINSCTDQTAIRLRLRGMNSTLSAGFASGLAAIDHAAMSIRLGRACAVLVGGVEALCDELCAGFADAGLMSRSGTIRPFAAGRDGTIPGEASAVLMVETEQGARNRGAHPWVEICGFASARSPRGGPEESATKSVLDFALASAGIGPENIGCIITSGNGSPGEDRAEALALASVFGRRIGEIPACAPKAGFGECLGASGALLALVAGIALERHCVPPTPGSHENEYGLRLSEQTQPFEGDYSLVDAFGCGNNAALLLKSL